jgi:3,4-dihydroxy 2-butanone 4-phosphate synthase / GTP cyclohydrolase II
MIQKLADIETIIADAKAGRMFILVDDEDRENEGDLVIAADFADAAAINFMAKYGRGLICLPLTMAQVERLGLPPMARHNASRHETAFTVSIESREGISTGISAADRALTIKTAINPNVKTNDIVSPGHIFPLQARDGGVLVRAGHTEAAVDIARLAGLNPSGVICEIMSDDGTMARLPELLEFAKQFELNIASIADLIAYRRRREKLIERLYSAPFESEYSDDLRLHIYASKLEYTEHLAIVKGDVAAHSAPLVRMHTVDIIADLLLDKTCAKSGELQQAMQTISQSECGVLVLIRNLQNDILSKRFLHGERPPKDIREYGIGAQILQDLGITKMQLMTNNPKHVIGLDGYGLEIVNYLPINQE